ncbi:TonB-dependent receptor [Methylorubrum salsuginis]|uniref:Iron complex outermembrane recepter protein n=1 Tax=Methylorubrum salsuginis TaxID=414703 RepID=A0A1I4LDP7_9HYPH|nr:TonB-dependent receptor [Methylorubrum salsuginis]SFL89168.1 iron complex outermembrane recepter protein [Methylorubrum salsuginis]
MTFRVGRVSRGRIAGIALAGVSLGVMVQAAAAQTTAPALRSVKAGTSVRLAIPKGPLESGLVAFTEQAGVKLVYPTELTATLETGGVEGEFSPLDALTRLLEGTGLIHRPAGASTITLINPRYVQLGPEPTTAVYLDELSVAGEGRGTAIAAAGLPPRSGTVGQPPVPYAGGQVATGSRIGLLGNRSVMKTPFSTTGFTEKLIRNQEGRSAADIVTNDPSVRSDAPVFSDRDSFFIRGFSVTSVDTAFDGLFYLANPRRMQLDGIERVELLKGPTALLTGGVGRVGGTINLIPKRAYDEPLTRITNSYFSNANFGTHLDLGRRYGDAKEWGVRFNGAYRAGNTALDNHALEVSNATLGLDYRGERFRASLDMSHQRQNVTAPASLFSAVAPGIAIPRAPNGRINTASRFEYNDSVYDMVAGRVEYDILPETTVYVAGGVSRFRENSLSSFFTITDPNGSALNSYAIAPTGIEGYTGDVGFRSRFETGFIGHYLTVSAVEANNKIFRNGFIPGALGLPQNVPTNIYDPVYLPFGSIPNVFPRAGAQPLQADGLYRSVGISDTLSVMDDRILLTLGGRFQEVVSKAFQTRPGGVSPVGTETYGYAEGRFSPAVALAVQPIDNLTLYGNYIEALLEGPTAPGIGVSNPGAVFAPIVSKQKEVGVKIDFGTAMLTTGLFEIELPNAFAAPSAVPGGLPTFGLNGLQRNRGVEVNVYGEPVEGVRLLGGVSFIDAKLAKTAGGTFDGNDVPGVPDTSVSLYGEVDLPPWMLPGLTLTGRVLYSSSVFYDQGNTQVVPGWTRFDAGLRYAFEGYAGRPVLLRATVQNLFDEAYYASAARGFLGIGAPRTFILSASVDF